MEPREVVAQLWGRVQARDWIGVGDLLADGFVLEWPHDLVRLRGRANFVKLNRTYPEGWSIELLRIVSEGSIVVSEVRVPHPAVGPYYALSFYEVDDGRIPGGHAGETGRTINARGVRWASGASSSRCRSLYLAHAPPR